MPLHNGTNRSRTSVSIAPLTQDKQASVGWEHTVGLWVWDEGAQWSCGCGMRAHCECMGETRDAGEWQNRGNRQQKPGLVAGEQCL